MLSHDHFWYQDVTNCTVLKESKSKKLLRSPIDSVAPHKSYLIKIYFYPGLWQTIKYVFRKSKARKELSLAKLISGKGIPTIVPLKVKDIRKWGLLQQSAVLTEYLPDCMNLEELLLKQKVPDRPLKKRVIREYGKLARLIHDQGIYQDDFDPNNILYQKHQNGSFQLYFLDFERTRIVKNLSLGQKIHSLAKLNRMGRKLKKTDQMRFLTAYLGPQTGRKERREWVSAINQEENKVLVRDQRRARRECTSVNSRIGFVNYEGYQGYYRRRHHSRKGYTRSDIIHLIQTIEEKISGDAFRKPIPDKWLDITVPLDKEKEIFQVRFFEYGGFKYWLPGTIKLTPLIAAWSDDNGYLKNRSANFLPVAAVEKRISWHHYHGYLIRKN